MYNQLLKYLVQVSKRFQFIELSISAVEKLKKVITRQGCSHLAEETWLPPLQFPNQTRSKRFSFKHQDIAFYGCSEIIRTRNFTVFTVHATILDNLWQFLIFSNYIGEIDHFTFDLLKRSNA